MGRKTLNYCVDTNILLRAITRDDEAQAALADHILLNSPLIAITLSTLCELAWVLQRSYERTHAEVYAAIHALAFASNTATDFQAVEAGLAFLQAGRDFADGVIAHQGRTLGGKTFISFDRKAVALLIEQGYEAKLLGVR